MKFFKSAAQDENAAGKRKYHRLGKPRVLNAALF